MNILHIKNAVQLSCHLFVLKVLPVLWSMDVFFQPSSKCIIIVPQLLFKTAPGNGPFLQNKCGLMVWKRVSLGSSEGSAHHKAYMVQQHIDWLLLVPGLCSHWLVHGSSNIHILEVLMILKIATLYKNRVFILQTHSGEFIIKFKGSMVMRFRKLQQHAANFMWNGCIFYLFHVVISKNRVSRHLVLFSPLTSTLEMKPLGALSYYVHHVIVNNHILLLQYTILSLLVSIVIGQVVMCLLKVVGVWKLHQNDDETWKLMKLRPQFLMGSFGKPKPSRIPFAALQYMWDTHFSILGFFWGAERKAKFSLLSEC